MASGNVWDYKEHVTLQKFVSTNLSPEAIADNYQHAEGFLSRVGETVKCVNESVRSEQKQGEDKVHRYREIKVWVGVKPGEDNQSDDRYTVRKRCKRQVFRSLGLQDMSVQKNEDTAKSFMGRVGPSIFAVTETFTFVRKTWENNRLILVPCSENTTNALQSQEINVWFWDERPVNESGWYDDRGDEYEDDEGENDE